MRLSGRPASPPDSDLLRGARAVLNWSLMEAGRRASVSVSAVVSAEGRGATSSPAPPGDVDRLRRAYEDAGVRFLAGRDGAAAGRGLRLDGR